MHNVVDLVYLLGSWEEDNYFYYTEAHILQGKEENKKSFIEELKKDKTLVKLEHKGNFILTLNRKDAWQRIYLVLFDKRIIQTMPDIHRTDGTELWELASWDKKPLMNILSVLKENHEVKLKSLEEAKLDEIFLPHIMPKLSDKQNEILNLAVKEGYYDFPRRINLDGLAKFSKLSKPTVQQHLRFAEKKLIPFLTEKIV